MSAPTSFLPVASRAEALFREHQESIYRSTDRAFAALMVCQWLFAIGVAMWVAPSAWADRAVQPWSHLGVAIILGGLVSIAPILLGLFRPGRQSTRYVIAIGQALMSGLLIHLTGGRIETHFHVFGSLAFLAVYRDWPLLLPASLVIAADHLTRGIFWPESLFGVTNVHHLRWLEHAGWVLFEDVFLILACRRSVRETWHLVLHGVALQETNDRIEQAVHQRANEFRESMATTEVIIANALDAHILMDQEGTIMGWNPQAERIFGWSGEQVIGRRLSETIVPPGYREAHERGLRHFVETGEGPVLNKRIEIAGLHKAGHEFPVEISITAVSKQEGYAFSAFIRDITQRKEQECRQAVEHAITQLLSESNSLEAAAPDILRTVCVNLDWSVGAMWKLDQEGQVLRCIEVWSCRDADSAEFIERTRRSGFALGIGLPGRVWQSRKVEWIADITRDSNFPRVPYAATAGLRAGFAFPITSHDQVYGVMEFFAKVPREPDRKLLDMVENLAGQLSQFLARTREEQKVRVAKDQAEQAAREKAQILATVEAFFIGVTDQGIISEWTGRAEDIFGISLRDAIGRPLRDLPIEWGWDEILEALRKAGDTLTKVQLHKTRLTVPGAKEKFIKLTVSPLCEDRGVGYVIMGEDITERLVLEHDLAQAQKLESIGQLAAGIAHEINTPTQFVGDNVRFLSDSFSDIGRLLDQYQRLLAAAKTGACPKDLIETCEAANRGADLEYLLAEIPKAITQSAEGIGRVATIVRAMKEFAHPGNTEKVAVNLNKAIESTVTVARNEWKYVADLETKLDPSLPPVPCLVGEFNQVVLNMIVNATHAIADAVKGTGQKGTITIATGLVGKFAEIRITDTGTGIPEAIRHKIFDPFFTTKGVGKGTGQGLAIARSVVVDKHGGTITVDSEVGKGATFIIRLPLHALPATRSKEGVQ